MEEKTAEDRIKEAIDSLEKAKKDEPLFGEELDDDLNLDDLIKGGVWFKRGGKYYKVEKDPVTGKAQAKEKKWDDVVYLDDCIAFSNEQNPAKVESTKRECAIILENIQKIIANDNVGTSVMMLTHYLSEIMKTKYDNFKAIINKLHPYTILLILQAFGFTINLDTNQVFDVKHWYENTFEKFMPGPKTKAKFEDKTTHMFDFLNVLVHFINANPGILNADTVYDNDTYEATVRKSVGEGPTIPNADGSYIDRVYNIRFDGTSQALAYIKNSLIQQRRRFNLSPMTFFRFRSYLPSLAGLYIPRFSGNHGMFGGSRSGHQVQVGGQYFQYQVQQFNNMDNVNASARFAEQMFKRLNTRLNAANKKLHQKDIENFNLMLEKLKSHENKMYKFLSTFGDYVENTPGYGYRNETVRANDMKKFVEGLKNRGTRYLDLEEKIIDAIYKISLVADKVSGSTVKEGPIPL